MGASREDKAKSHERIVEIAATKMRQGGLDGPGVAEIMTAAGLTHGGFYKHFASRDQLVAEAVDHAFAESSARAAAEVEGAEDPLAAFVDWYASTRHCDDPGSGCAVVALADDVSRAGDEVRQSYQGQVSGYLERLEALLPEGPDRRRRAVVALSALVGSVLVARAVPDPELADELLADVRSFVTSGV